uniref:G-protein coupled receptors family 1 profile domain-containing protein n=1 Tax=Sarcophilus harrisii TaxID=9305 RepID=A0A7N4NNZ6_SARHA
MRLGGFLGQRGGFFTWDRAVLFRVPRSPQKPGSPGSQPQAPLPHQTRRCAQAEGSPRRVPLGGDRAGQAEPQGFSSSPDGSGVSSQALLLRRRRRGRPRVSRKGPGAARRGQEEEAGTAGPRPRARGCSPPALTERGQSGRPPARHPLTRGGKGGTPGRRESPPEALSSPARPAHGRPRERQREPGGRSPGERAVVPAALRREPLLRLPAGGPGARDGRVPGPVRRRRGRQRGDRAADPALPRHADHHQPVPGQHGRVRPAHPARAAPGPVPPVALAALGLRPAALPPLALPGRGLHLRQPAARRRAQRRALPGHLPPAARARARHPPPRAGAHRRALGRGAALRRALPLPRGRGAGPGPRRRPGRDAGGQRHPAGRPLARGGPAARGPGRPRDAGERRERAVQPGVPAQPGPPGRAARHAVGHHRLLLRARALPRRPPRPDRARAVQEPRSRGPPQGASADRAGPGIIYINTEDSRTMYFSQYFNIVALQLFYLSASINPVLYNLISKKYRAAAYKLLFARQSGGKGSGTRDGGGETGEETGGETAGYTDTSTSLKKECSHQKVQG